MKVRSIDLGDDELPEAVTVTMTTDEAAVIYAIVGHLSPKAVTEAGGDIRWGNAVYDVADCLSGAFFNRFWDDGASAVCPRLSPYVHVRETP